MYAYISFLTFTIIHLIFGCEHYHDPACQNVKPIIGDHFLNQFIAEIQGGEEMAQQVARDIGFEYKKPVKTHKDHYYFTHQDVYDRHKTRHEDVLKILREHKAVLTADQQYVWRPTIRELETYEDMVGLEEPLEVRTSHFDPEEIEIEGKSAWELIRPDDVFTEPEPLLDYPPIHTLVDFEKLYEEKNREKEKRAQKRHVQEERHLIEELEKKLQEEIQTAATLVTSDDDEKDPKDGKIDKVGNPESSGDEKVPQDLKIKQEKTESFGDKRVLENPKIGEKNAELDIKGKIKVKPKTTELAMEARKLPADDEATVETYDEE